MPKLCRLTVADSKEVVYANPAAILFVRPTSDDNRTEVEFWGPVSKYQFVVVGRLDDVVKQIDDAQGT